MKFFCLVLLLFFYSVVQSQHLPLGLPSPKGKFADFDFLKSDTLIQVTKVNASDSVVVIAPLIVASPNWIANDSVDLWAKGYGPNQGNAWDEHYRYVDSNSAIYKIDGNYNIVWVNRNPFSGLTGISHMGDFFWNKTDGHLYVPMETINGSGTVFSGQTIGVFDTADGHRITTIDAAAQHASEITAFTKYDSSIASIDFALGRIIYLRSFADASVLDSISLSLPIPGTQGITFDSTNRLFYIISETKLWSAKEDGSAVLELMTLPHDVLGHVGEGLEMIGSSLTALVASRGSSLSKLYTFQSYPTNRSHIQRGSFDGNGIGTLRYVNVGNVSSSISPITIYDGTPSKIALVNPNSISNGYIGSDGNATTFTRNAYYNKGWRRNNPLEPSFYLSFNGTKGAAYMLVTNAGTGKIAWDTAWKAEPGGRVIIKPSVGSSYDNQVVSAFSVEPPQINNTLGYANVTRTAVNIQHNETASMMRMQNTATGGGTVFFHVTNSANSSGGKKFLINFADNTSTPLATFDSANQSLRIREHITVGTSLNKNPSGLGTVSFSVSDKSTDGRPQVDITGNRNGADQVSGQVAYYNNTKRFATISGLRGTSDSTGYLSFATKDATADPVIRMTIAEKGYVGVGITTPTALLDVAANTSAASQLRLRDGVTPTSLLKGYMWFDGTALNFYNGSTTKNLLGAGTGTGYKVYSALLNQSGTSAPTATVLENTMGETFTFSYDDVGRFIITSPSNKFISNKTFMVNGNPIISEGVTGEIALSVASTSAIIIKTTELAAGAAKNGVLINSPIEIRVYN